MGVSTRMPVAILAQVYEIPEFLEVVRFLLIGWLCLPWICLTQVYVVLRTAAHRQLPGPVRTASRTDYFTLVRSSSAVDGFDPASVFRAFASRRRSTQRAPAWA